MAAVSCENAPYSFGLIQAMNKWVFSGLPELRLSQHPLSPGWPQGLS